MNVRRRSGAPSNLHSTIDTKLPQPEAIMPERSVAQSVHAALVLLGWAGLITAGVCFPAMAILTHFYTGGEATALYWLGPTGLFVGCLSSVLSIFFAQTVLGL